MDQRILIFAILAFCILIKLTEGKQGCPLYLPGLSTNSINKESCNSDANCTNGKICCHNGHENICETKCPEEKCNCIYGIQYYTTNRGCRGCRCVPNPCSFSKCPAGSHCVLHKFPCYTPPCFPMPVCIQE